MKETNLGNILTEVIFSSKGTISPFFKMFYINWLNGLKQITLATIEPKAQMYCFKKNNFSFITGFQHFSVIVLSFIHNIAVLKVVCIAYLVYVGKGKRMYT